MNDSNDPTLRDSSGFSASQLVGLETREADQARTLEAIHALEGAAASPAPGRETEWRRQILSALADLDDVMTEELRNSELPESLLSDIRRTQPRLRTRVRGVRSQYLQIRQGIADLREEVGQRDLDDKTDFADLRTRIGWLLTALRHQRARESDLIYQAYYDAFNDRLDESDSASGAY